MFTSDQIGWYVHWHHSNYAKWGTNFNPVSKKGKKNGYKSASYGGAKAPSQLATYFIGRRKHIISGAKKNLSKINKNDLKELEALYTSLLFPKGNLSKAEQTLLNNFRKEWERIFKKFNNGYLLFNEDGFLKKAAAYSEYEGKASLNYKEVNEIINILQSTHHRSGSEKTAAQIAQDSALIDKINKIFKDENIFRKNNKDLFKEIEERFTNRNYAGMFGYALEDFIVAANQVVDGIVGKVTKKIYKEMSVGKNVSGAIIESSSMTDFIGHERKGNIFGKKENDTDFEYHVKKTPNKTDIIFEYKGQPLKMSAKYVGITNNKIKIHQGSSFLTMLQKYPNDISTHWFNHYLNISTAPEDSVYKQYAKARMEAIETFKVLLAVKGLTGQIAGRTGQAEIFTVADAKAKRVRIITMADMLSNLNKLIYNNGIMIQDSGGKNAKDLNLNLIPVKKTPPRGNYKPDMGEARDRITNILAYLHQQKFTVSLDKSRLFKY